MKRPLALVMLLVLAVAGCTGGGQRHVSAHSTVSRSPAPREPGLVEIAAPPLSSSARPLADGSCSVGQLRGFFAGSAGGMTGEHAAFVDVWNVSHRSCVLVGYPRVELFARSGPLGFRYRDGGYYIHDHPGRIPLRPGMVGSFVIAKYRCDLGSLTQVTTIRFSADGSTTWLAAEPLENYHQPDLFYCKSMQQPTSSDPGNTIQLGPWTGWRLLGAA